MCNWNTVYQREKALNWKRYIEAYCERSKVPYFLMYSEWYILIRYMWLELDIKETDVVLDDGCGAGYPKELLDEIGLRYGSYIGIDMSNVGILRMKERRVGENALLICGDACKLPLKDSSVDKIFSYSVIEWVNNPDDYCREIYRVLKKDGRAIVLLVNRLNYALPYYLAYPIAKIGKLSKPNNFDKFPNQKELGSLFGSYFNNVNMYKKCVSCPPYMFSLTKKYAPPIYYLLNLLFKVLNKIEKNIENTPILNSFCRMLIIEVRK